MPSWRPAWRLKATGMRHRYDDGPKCLSFWGDSKVTTCNSRMSLVIIGGMIVGTLVKGLSFRWLTVEIYTRRR